VQLAEGMRYVAIIRDITERKQVEQMKAEFVSTVSHELRTPLTSIAGSLGLLRGGAVGNLPPPATRLIEVADNNARRLIRLINDILDIEKIESGGAEFDIKPVELRSLIEQAIEANQGFAAKHGVRLALTEGMSEARVMADPDRLAQVLTNLLSNAAKFSPEGRTIRVSVTPLDRQHRITVSDRGAGIPADFRDRIFGKFAQADSSDTRQKGGTGLGLSIVREIVTRLGGSVGFEDRPGGGTNFHVDLPAVQELRAGERKARAADSVRVLHVEDDPDVLRVTADSFGDRASLDGAHSLESARTLLHANSYDVVIMDIGLPDGAGPDLLPEIRRPGATEPGIVIFSAEDCAATPGRADAVLTKSRATLEELVETVLALARRIGARKAA
jgi:nitrogen-specific signal transduction histidine kinase/CheY-like chemotaxis protein